jgi:hypothetical protein
MGGDAYETGAGPTSLAEELVDRDDRIVSTRQDRLGIHHDPDVQTFWDRQGVQKRLGRIGVGSHEARLGEVAEADLDEVHASRIDGPEIIPDELS